MKQVEIQQAQERLLELIELAASGEEVIISRDQEPLAKLTPIRRRARQRHFGSAKGLIILSDDFDEPLEDFAEYM